MSERENLVEMNEAIIAGKQALSSMKMARESLRSAGNWGIADLLGGGFIVNMIKHSRLDEAAKRLEEAKRQMRRFQKELRDVELPCEVYVHVDGFLTFADFFFDGIVADWLVQSRINDAKEELDEAIDYVENVIADLQSWEKRYMLGKGACV